MEYAIYGVKVGGNTYYPRPIYDGTVSGSGNIYIDTVYPDLSFDNNLSFIIRFPVDYKGRLESDYNLTISDYMSIIINYNGVPLKYIDIKAGDCFELVNYDGHNWSLLSLNTKCMDITYRDLKWLRDNSYLIPGMKYRIIDYETIDRAQSFENFGLISDDTIYRYATGDSRFFELTVTAETVNTLNPMATASNSLGRDNGYWDDTDMSKWKIWYSLDTDGFEYGYELGVGGEINSTDVLSVRPRSGINTAVNFLPINKLHNINLPDKSQGATAYAAVQDGNLILWFPYHHETQNIVWGTFSPHGLTTIRSCTDNGSWYSIVDSTGRAIMAPKNEIRLVNDSSAPWRFILFYHPTLKMICAVDKLSNSMYCMPTINTTSLYQVLSGSTKNTKGVIYRMIDEYNNDCPYDFKSIVSNLPFFSYGGAYTFGPSPADSAPEASSWGGATNNTIEPSFDDYGNYVFPYVSLGNGWNVKDCHIGSSTGVYTNAPTERLKIGRGSSFIRILSEEIENVEIGENCQAITLAERIVRDVKIGNNNTSIYLSPNTTEVAMSSISIGDNNESIETTDNLDCRCCSIGNYNEDISIFCADGCSIGNCNNNISGLASNSVIGDSNIGIQLNSVSDQVIGNNNANVTVKTGASTCCIGNNCNGITIGERSLNCVIGDYCRNITIGNNCYNNTFHSACSGCTLADGSYHNIFGAVCTSIELGTSNMYNIFGSRCSSIKLPASCSYNTFGSRCSSIKFGANSMYNAIGNNCSYVYFKDSKSSAGNDRTYCQYNTVKDDVKNLVIYSTVPMGSTAKLMNVNVISSTYTGSWKYAGSIGTNSTTAIHVTMGVSNSSFTAS